MNHRPTTFPLVVLIPFFLLGGCVSGGYQGERDSAMGWWAMTTPGVLGSILGERDAAMATSSYEELEKIGEREIEGLKDVPSPKLMPLCVSYSKLKRYNKLFPCLDRIEDNIRKGDNRSMDFDEFAERNPVMAGMTWMGFGIGSGRKGFEGDISTFPFLVRAEAYIDLARYPEAVEQAKKAEAHISPQWKQERWGRIMSTSLMGLAYALDGERENALKAATELEKISTDYPYTLLGGDKATGLTKIHLALKDYSKALEAIEQGKDTLFGSLAKGVSGMIVIGETKGKGMWVWQELPREFIYNKGLFEVGRINEAKVGYDKLLQIPQTRENGDLYWVILFDRGRIAEQEGDLKGAVGYYRQAVDVIEQQRSTINTEASKIGFVGDKQAVYARLIATLVEQGQAGEAFDYVERSKSRALVDMLASKKDFAAPVSDPEKVKLVLAQLDAADLGTRVQDASTKSNAQPTGTRNLLVARDALQSAAPELSSLVTVTSVPSAKLGSLVGADETLIEYYYNGDNLIAFVLSRAGLSVTKLDGAGLDSQVQALRTAIEQPGTKAWQTLSRALYGKLWKPLETSITTKNVIIVAHGSLHYLPFNVLQAEDGGLLIDRVGLRFLPSASVLKFLHPLPAKNDSQLLVLGNPDLGDAKLDLKFAESEARLIAGMSKTSRLLVRLDASEANLKKTAGIFSRLHFATHGKFQADDPLSSGLYLAKDAKNDGVLTVGELYSMNLDADLVTLSACETGLGKVANGDDVVGLTRGFLYAGSRSIVASLWSVDDQSTATLMKAFYENLSNQNKQEALRLAQLKTRKTFPHPFYWAAFQLTGRAD